MTELWTTLIPLGIVIAILPVQLAVTILMLRGAGGRLRASAWIGGMTLVRLAQYALLAAILEPAIDDGQEGTSLIEGVLLLLVAFLLFVSAARKATNQTDEDAPAPRWMTLAAELPARRAFLAGAGLVALSPKLWAFTLAAVGAIGDADLGGAQGWAAFATFVVIAQGLHLSALALAVIAPDRAEPLLGRTASLLERHSRPLAIGVSLAFGVWFLVKALRALGFV